MFVPVQDNYLAIYPFYCFWFFKPFLKMNVKEFSFSCVSLFNYQGSCRLTAPTFYHIVFRLSSTFLKSFFAAFRHLCSFATAILDYHICTSLSRTFLNFFFAVLLYFVDSSFIISWFISSVNTFFTFIYIFFIQYLRNSSLTQKTGQAFHSACPEKFKIYSSIL